MRSQQCACAGQGSHTDHQSAADRHVLHAELLQQHVRAWVPASSAQLTLSLTRAGTLLCSGPRSYAMLWTVMLRIAARRSCLQLLLPLFCFLFGQCFVGTQRGSFSGPLVALCPFCSACGGYHSVRVRLAGCCARGAASNEPHDALKQQAGLSCCLVRARAPSLADFMCLFVAPCVAHPGGPLGVPACVDQGW